MADSDELTSLKIPVAVALAPRKDTTIRHRFTRHRVNANGLLNGPSMRSFLCSSYVFRSRVDTVRPQATASRDGNNDGQWDKSMASQNQHTVAIAIICFRYHWPRTFV